MEVKDEIKQISEIIDKIGNVREEEWQQLEGETEEEYNARILEIEDEIEEELLDYISDSVLAEQEIEEEEEAVKEAQEKIEADYQLFSEAFEEEGETVKLKSQEELIALGYSSAEEIERLKEIENNKNKPEQYIDKVKESIHKEKDIDTEINRKMDLAKAIISAKKRGENIAIGVDQNVKRNKFEKANDQIANTVVLKRVPLVQDEYVRNNIIAEKQYINMLSNINSQSSNIPTAKPVQRIVQGTQRRVPKRKNEVFLDLEKKLDKDNESTKQKILARTELKKAFNEYAEMLKNGQNTEISVLENKISEVANKFPNVVDEKLIDKISKKFNIGLVNSLGLISGVAGIKKLAEEFESPKKEIGENVTEIMQEQEINEAKPSENEPEAEQEAETEMENINEQEVAEASAETEPKTEQEVILEPKKISNEGETEGISAQKKTILGILSKDSIDENAIFKEDNWLSFIANYLRKNEDEFIKDKFNILLSKVESRLGDNFENDFYNKDIELNVGLLGQLSKLYKSGRVDLSGNVIVHKDMKKASDYLVKEMTYFMYLKKMSERTNIGSIERLKSQAKYSKACRELEEDLVNKVPFLSLIMSKENAKRSGDIKDISTKVQKYKERIENEGNIPSTELYELGDVFYNGINDLSGNTILKPDKFWAKKVYEELVSSYPEMTTDITHNRLFALYSDKTLPTYDESKANSLKEKMENNGIEIRKEEKNRDFEENTSHVYVCSDLHGEYPAYSAIVSRLKPDDKLYVLGDVIDREPDGIKILQDIMRRKEKGQAEFLIGNHEWMMVQSLFLNDETQRKNWEVNNEGKVTREAFEKLGVDEQEEIKNFLLDSFVYKNINIDNEDVHLVHAKAIQDRDSKEDKTLREMLNEGKVDLINEAVWSRAGEKYTSKEIAKPDTFTVIGHTPTDSNMVEYQDGHLDIDCGAAYYFGNAGLVDLKNGTITYFDMRKERKKAKEEEER